MQAVKTIWDLQDHPEYDSDLKLLAHYADLLDIQTQVAQAKGRLEQEIWRRMEERGAIAIPDETWVCEAKTRTTYLPIPLTPLKEILSEADLETCYTPAHMEMIPDRWDGRKVLPLARRYGDVALGIVEKAKLTERAGLKFEKKESPV